MISPSLRYEGQLQKDSSSVNAEMDSTADFAETDEAASKVIADPRNFLRFMLFV